VLLAVHDDLDVEGTYVASECVAAYGYCSVAGIQRSLSTISLARASTPEQTEPATSRET